MIRTYEFVFTSMAFNFQDFFTVKTWIRRTTYLICSFIHKLSFGKKCYYDDDNLYECALNTWHLCYVNVEIL